MGLAWGQSYFKPQVATGFAPGDVDSGSEDPVSSSGFPATLCDTPFISQFQHALCNLGGRKNRIRQSEDFFGSANYDRFRSSFLAPAIWRRMQVSGRSV